MNNVTLIGRLTRDVELRRTNTGKPVASFTLAVQRDKDNADFINCIAWDKTAELLERYTQKGDRIGLEGRIQTRTYDTNDGRKAHVTEIVANKIELLESKPKQAEQTQAYNNQSQQNTTTLMGRNGTTWDIADDDIQF